jgi:hypothetical protein
MMRQMMGERMSGLFLFANVRAIQEKLELRFFFLGGSGKCLVIGVFFTLKRWSNSALIG